MRRILSILIAVVVGVSVPGAIAQEQAPQEAQEANAPPVVLVLPFTMLGDDARHEWLGQGIQQNLQAELSRAGLDVIGTVQMKPVNRVPLLVQPADEAAEALKMAADARADVVIFGSHQVVDQDVRITGQVVDVASGQTVGFLKANGTLRDVLGLEDELAAQALSFFKAVPEEGMATEAAATRAAEPAVVEEEVVYEPSAETSVVYSPRYYDDDIDDYDWVGAATFTYPTYYPVGYYYPTYSYYYKPWCYRPWYYYGFSFGIHYDRYHHHYYDDHHRHRHYGRYAWHDDDRHTYPGRSHYYGWRGDDHDRGPRFRSRDDDRDSRSTRSSIARRYDRSPNATLMASAGRTGSKSQPTRTYRGGHDSRFRTDWATNKRMPQVGPTLPKSREPQRPRVTSRDEGDKRVIRVPQRETREAPSSGRREPVKRVEPPPARPPAADPERPADRERSSSSSDRARSSGSTDRDRAARLLNPPSRTRQSEVGEPDRAARLLGKDESSRTRSTPRSDPDRAAGLLRGDSSSRSSVRRESTPSRSSSSGIRSSSSGRSSSSIRSSGDVFGRSAVRSPSPAPRSAPSVSSRSAPSRSSISSGRSSESSFRSSSSSSRSSGSASRSSGSSSRSSSGGSSRGGGGGSSGRGR